MEVIQIEMKETEGFGFLGDIHADSAQPTSRIDDYSSTVLKKLVSVRDICVENNVTHLMLLGDVFNKIAMPNELINKVGKTFQSFKEKGIEVYSIVGNHDLSRNTIDTLEKSPLSILFNFGVIKHIHVGRRIVINKKTLITGLDYTDELVRGNSKASVNILCAHRFYQNDHDEANISFEDVSDLGYDSIVLGHDHVQYPIVREGRTDIVRPGSLTRGTSHDYNFFQTPRFYALFNVNYYHRDNWETYDIPCMDADKIMSSHAKNQKKVKKDLSSIMSDLVSRISMESGKKSDSIYDSVKNDEGLDPKVKNLLLRYFKESFIS